MLALHKAGLYDGLFTEDNPASPKVKKVKSRTKEDKPKEKEKKKEKTKEKEKANVIPFPQTRQFLASPVHNPTPHDSTSAPIHSQIQPLEITQGNQNFAARVEPIPVAQEKSVVFCRALHNYDAGIPDGLSFRKGDIIEVLSQDASGWWDAYFGDVRGWIPSNYVVLLSEDEAAHVISESPRSASTLESPTVWTPRSSPNDETSPPVEWRHPWAPTSDGRGRRAWHLPMRLGDSGDSELEDSHGGLEIPLPLKPKKSFMTSRSSNDSGSIQGKTYSQSLISHASESKVTLKERSGSAVTFGFPIVDDVGLSMTHDSGRDSIYGAKAIPWYLQPSVPPDIMLGEDGSVKGGSLPALVERLTAHEQVSDRAFAQAFLMTFKTFASIDELVDALIDRFRIAPPPGLMSNELEEWISMKQRVVQIRVLNVFKLMVQGNDIIENDDHHVVARIREFVQEKDVSCLPAAQVLSNLVERRRSGSSLHNVVSNTTLPPSPIIPRANKKMRFVDIDPLEAARQLTILESELFQRIRPFECLKRVRERKAEHMDNIAIVIQTSNKIADWVADLVLSKQDPWKRAQIVRHFISIADRCRHLKNFSTMVAIISGLSSPPIRRLKQTWEHVNQRSMKELAACEGIIDSNKNFSNYRKLMASMTPPCIPFIGVFLSTLQFIQDGNPDNHPNGRINFRKRQKFAEVISDTKRWQSHSYNLQRVPVIMDFIEDSLGPLGERFHASGGGGSSSSDKYWNLSLEREPRERCESGDGMAGMKDAFSVQDSWFLFLGNEGPGSPRSG
ncbi:cell division control protein 25 [Coprinopsis cinerea AmutBmut pab1-1]|nr:cell division control protein 25 [Coprinopsis cinerea AmutBmut pab1-1]